MIGGSYAGSAAAVALGIVPFAIGSDTGDSVRKPASYGGLVGFKPTYGRISRYGLFPFASSLDHVAMFTRNVRDAAIVTDVLKGKDINDMTTLNDDGKCYEDLLDKDIQEKKLFYIKEICGIDTYKDNEDDVVNKTIKEFHESIKKIKKLGFAVEEVSIDKSLLEAIYPTYMCISCAEATSNNSNLTGIQFGSRGDGESIEEIMFNARTNGFSELIKRRFVLGSYVLQKENQEKLFLNAQQLSYRYLILENHMVIGNFGGFPSITLPFTMINDMPVGMNITGRVKEDALVLNMASKIEGVLELKGIYSKVGDINV